MLKIWWYLAYSCNVNFIFADIKRLLCCLRWWKWIWGWKYLCWGGVFFGHAQKFFVSDCVGSSSTSPYLTLWQYLEPHWGLELLRRQKVCISAYIFPLYNPIILPGHGKAGANHSWLRLRGVVNHGQVTNKVMNCHLHSDSHLWAIYSSWVL